MSECPQQELASIRLIQPTFHSAGYAPCPDRRFCCPSGNYCFYDVNNAPECWQGMYYTFYYSYSWSYSFGIRWFTTTSTYYLNGPTVLAISTPPPPSTAPRTGATEPSPSPSSTFTVALSTETSAASAGSARRRLVWRCSLGRPRVWREVVVAGWTGLALLAAIVVAFTVM